MPIRRMMPDVDERIAAVQYAIGNPSNLLVIRYCLTHGPSTRNAISSDTDISLTAISRSIADLEERGYLTATHAADERTGRTVTYEARTRLLMQDAAAFFAWLFGGDPPATEPPA